ncbi:hypothetical protein AVEN_230956-1 [Araneus ventricosus]|uniref:Histone-lysine N-methyltransferase SETMAR n=1 Tax=Araneus ventricosus TaxID=182803 RepID=A0A4Y2A463_ARAVE|nr:hypothetical protein AVEN_230956-1 [Araneus ventricosus]
MVGRKSVIEEHRSGRPTMADKARRHNTTFVKRFLPQHVVTELSHPPSPYSPDLSLSNFFLFPKLKVALKGRIFTDIMLIEAAVTRELYQWRSFQDLSTICTHVVRGAKYMMRTILTIAISILLLQHCMTLAC